MTDLGSLGGGISMANAINNKGQIIGWSSNMYNERHAFLYENGTMKDLGTLEGVHSDATDINESGTIVGHSYTAFGDSRICI